MSNQVIGILGGGQLGRMLTQSAKSLGFDVVVVDPTPNCPAAQVGAQQIVAAHDDSIATEELARRADIITIESEHINSDVLNSIYKNNVAVYPAPRTIALILDKYKQKQAWSKAGLPVSDFENAKGVSFEILSGRLGLPFHLKSRIGAFDGRGNRVIRTEKDWVAATKELDKESSYAEKHVDFAAELSVLVAKERSGKMHTYPVVETVHRDNICHLVYSPARVHEDVTKEATSVALKTVEQLDGAGVYAVELFADKNGHIFINEVAPRVHNSGHHTIEGNHTSQFEQHIRAITGLPVGNTGITAPATVMINILGETEGPMHNSGLDEALSLPDTHVHLYGKTPIKKQRKMGHITVCADDMTTAENNANKARKSLKI